MAGLPHSNTSGLLPGAAPRTPAGHSQLAMMLDRPFAPPTRLTIGAVLALGRRGRSPAPGEVGTPEPVDRAGHRNHHDTRTIEVSKVSSDH